MQYSIVESSDNDRLNTSKKNLSNLLMDSSFKIVIVCEN